MYIGLISDTHGLFDNELCKFLEPVEQVWHAGDFGNEHTLDEIAAFKPLIGVYGNCDDWDVREKVPLYQSFNAGGMKILMTHIGGFPGRYDYNAFKLIEEIKPDVFVCGHSHILRVMNDKKRDMMVLNPGAAGVMGFHTVRTALRFKIENGEIKDLDLGQWERKA